MNCWWSGNVEWIAMLVLAMAPIFVVFALIAIDRHSDEFDR